MKGYIYSIRSHQTKDIYIGSTEQKLSSRMSGHRRDYKCWLHNNKFHYVSSYEILKYSDAYIELITEVEFQNKPELRKIEGEHQRKIDCVNKRISGNTNKEWCDANRKSINKSATKYYQKNKEKIYSQENVCKKKYHEKNRDSVTDQYAANLLRTQGVRNPSNEQIEIKKVKCLISRVKKKLNEPNN